MPITLIIWGVGAPIALALLSVLLLTPWRATERQSSPRLGILLPLGALGLGYAIGNWGVSGGPRVDPLHGRLLYIGLACTVAGAFVAVLNLPKLLLWLLRLALCIGAAAVLVVPLAKPQGWSTTTLALAISAVGLAATAAWGSLAKVLDGQDGPLPPLAILMIGSAGSAAVLLSGQASTAQVQGSLLAGLGVFFVAAWRWPLALRLRATAPLLTVLPVCHWAVGLFYADLRPAAFGLLVAAIVALSITQLPPLRRLGGLFALLLYLAAALIPSGAAVGWTAREYFAAEQASSESSPSSVDDYGY